MRKGFTLVECMLASSLFGLMILGVFEGVIVSTRIAHENADLLAAEAVAWDAVWKRFNEDFDGLALGRSVETLSEKQAPQLADYDESPVLTVTVGLTDEAEFFSSPTKLKKITADLEWGPASNRRKLSDEGKCPQVFRSSLGRAN